MSFRRKLVMVADSGSGKSSLAYRMALGIFPGEYRPNVFETFVAEGEVDGTRVELALWEMVAHEEYDRLRPLTYASAHVILLCFAIDDPDSLKHASDKWISEVKQYCPGVPIILVGCKKDLRDTSTIENVNESRQHPIMPEEGQAVAQSIGAKHYLECSAKTDDGVREVFQHAARASLLKKQKCTTKCIIV